MSVILVRHADAEESSQVGDGGRVLTALGRRQARDTGQWLAGFVRRPALIWTSPFVRTVQTAELLLSTWGTDSADGTLATSAALRAGQTAAGAVTLAHAHADQVLVGHQPMMGELAAELLGRSSLPFGFDKAAALVLEATAEGGFRFRGYRVPFEEPLLQL